MAFGCIARSLPSKNLKGDKMTENEMEKMICYLADKVEKLEKERCKVNDKKPKAEPPEHSMISKPQAFITNYDEDEECISCSA